MNPGKPLPTPTDLTRPYWQAAQENTLCIQRCVACRHWIHFPEVACPKCQAESLGYEPVSGKGRIESFTVVHRSFVPGYDQVIPYVLAWVELEEQTGLRVFSNILDCDPESLAIGQAVTLCFENRDGFGNMPQFRPNND